ncbi:MAG: GDSL family lipase [Oscillospiraceae bacterium]|nr:GDSL family lipase [Oscillospiraceae bacterium]
MQTKRIAAIAAVMLAVQAVLPLNAAAANVNDVQHLVKTLTTNGAMTTADDFNGDGIINAVDLTLMKRALIAEAHSDTGELRTQTVTAITEQTKLIGRTLTKNGVTWLVHSGSAVECTVTGTEASVTIAGDNSINSSAKYRPRYGVYVDGTLIKDVVMGEKEQIVKLFSGTEKRTATVKVMHLSEANNGAIGVKQFDVTSSAAKPVQPTAKKDLMIEFVGDSITCAYGVGAASQNEGFETGTEDFSKSYAYLAAQMLDADYSAVSYSGYGVISGYTGDGNINAGSLVPPVYENVAKFGDYAVPWDFASHPVDVVFINLGTNDDSYAKHALATRAKEYQANYLAFLKQVRQCNPDAAIVCTLGIMGCQELYPYLEAAVKEFGDAKTSCYESPSQNMADGLGADWHPSPVTHEKNAYLAAEQISKALGIPFDAEQKAAE